MSLPFGEVYFPQLQQHITGNAYLCSCRDVIEDIRAVREARCYGNATVLVVHQRQVWRTPKREKRMLVIMAGANGLPTATD